MISPLPHGGNALQKRRNLSTRKVGTHTRGSKWWGPQQVTNNNAKQSKAQQASNRKQQTKKKKKKKFKKSLMAPTKPLIKDCVMGVQSY
jgi:hypothetical protein